MDDAGSFFASDATEIVDVMQEGVNEGSGRVARGRMDDHAGGLVDDDDVVILIHDGQRDRLGLWSCVDRLRDIDADVLPRLEGAVGFCRPTLNLNAAVLDEALDLRPRLVGPHRHQKVIETDAVAVGWNREDHAALWRARRGSGS